MATPRRRNIERADRQQMGETIGRQGPRSVVGLQSPQVLAPLDTTRIVVQSPLTLRPLRLVVFGEVDAFDILSLTLGKWAQFPADTPLPARAFAEYSEQIPIELVGGPLSIGDEIAIDVRHVGPEASRFRGALYVEILKEDSVIRPTAAGLARRR